MDPYSLLKAEQSELISRKGRLCVRGKKGALYRITRHNETTNILTGLIPVPFYQYLSPQYEPDTRWKSGWTFHFCSVPKKSYKRIDSQTVALALLLETDDVYVLEHSNCTSLSFMTLTVKSFMLGENPPPVFMIAQDPPDWDLYAPIIGEGT